MAVTDDLVVVDPALKVVIDPETVLDLMVSTGLVKVVREGVTVLLMVVIEPPLRVEGTSVTKVLPETGGVTKLLPGTEETTVEDSTTIAEVTVAGGGRVREVDAGGAGAHAAVTVTVE